MLELKNFIKINITVQIFLLLLILFTDSISVSPAKWTKKKHKPMENLQSYVVLLRQLMEALNTYIKQADNKVI